MTPMSACKGSKTNDAHLREALVKGYRVLTALISGIQVSHVQLLISYYS